MDELKRLTELLNAKTAEIEALLDDEGARETPLSDEEQAKLDALDGECDKLKAEIVDLTARLDKRAELQRKQDARKQMLATQPARPRTSPDTPGGLATKESTDTAAGGNDQADRMEQLHQIIPVRHYRPKHFKGPDGDYNAYASGCWMLAQFGDPNDQAVVAARDWCREHLAMGGSANSKGGALVIPEFSTTIIDLKQTYGIARREATVEPMASDTKTVPVQVSGPTAYAVGESGEVTASDLGWTNLDLVAKKWGVLTKHSSELDADSIVSIADKVAQQAAWALAKKEDECAFLGDGTSTYHGINGMITEVFATAAAKITATAANLAFSTLDLVDFGDMVGALAEYAVANAKWYISKVGWAASMLRLIEAAGGQTGEMIAGKVQPYFLSFPVVITQVMNRTTANQASADGLAYLGDLKAGVMLGDRQAIRMKVSDQRYLEFDQIGILIIQRHDVVVHGIGGYADDDSDNGPIIGLSTPAQ